MNQATTPIAPRRRLSRADRQEQLLRTALMMVREEGTSSLTLARVAERAGVTKPVAYDHFGSTDGLLVALYKAIDQDQSRALFDAMAAEPHDLASAARRISDAYMHCYADTSGEWQAVAGALRGNPEIDATHRELLSGYVDRFGTALGRYSELPAPVVRVRCVGLVGAAEALSSDMVRGGLLEAEASAALADLIVAAFGQR